MQFVSPNTSLAVCSLSPARPRGLLVRDLATGLRLESSLVTRTTVDCFLTGTGCWASCSGAAFSGSCLLLSRGLLPVVGTVTVKSQLMVPWTRQLFPMELCTCEMCSAMIGTSGTDLHLPKHQKGQPDAD